MKKMEDITMKGTLTYKLPEESDEFSTAFNGHRYKAAVEDIWQTLFRPRHKHGYPVAALEKLFESEPDGNGPLNHLMDELEKLYFQACETLPTQGD